MNLINSIVTHKCYGKGIIVKADNNYVIVKFSNSIKTFSYPSAFDKFLIAENPKIQAEILEKIFSTSIPSAPPEPIIPSPENKIDLNTLTKKFFYVFQGKTFDQEARGGYIWAPKRNQHYQTFHHWDRLLDVHKGDLIFHGSQGEVKAISIAKEKCYDCEQPKELGIGLWIPDGRKIDCQYIILRNTFTTNSLKNSILNFSTKSNEPFNSSAKGKQGYLFDLNPNLAKIFFETAKKYNSNNSMLNDISQYFE